MISYEMYKEQHSDMLRKWTDRLGELIYKCDVLVGISPEFLEKRLYEHNYVNLYSYAINKLRGLAILSPAQRDFLVYLQKALFNECCALIEGYCFGG